jgi:cell division septation protein DedD
MKKAIFLSFLLTGCASEPMTDEQRAIAMQYLLNRPQPQPYVLPMPAPVQPLPVQPAPQVVAPRSCQSTINGQTINTTCF